MNPDTKKWVIAIRRATMQGIGKSMAMNLSFNKDWYTDEMGKPLKLRLTAEEKDGKQWRELEEYKITKDWKVKGFFEWDKL